MASRQPARRNGSYTTWINVSIWNIFVGHLSRSVMAQSIIRSPRRLLVTPQCHKKWRLLVKWRSLGIHIDGSGERSRLDEVPLASWYTIACHQHHRSPSNDIDYDTRTCHAHSTLRGSYLELLQLRPTEFHLHLPNSAAYRFTVASCTLAHEHGRAPHPHRSRYVPPLHRKHFAIWLQERRFFLRYCDCRV